MITQDQLNRINELAKKKKEAGLTVEETEEQAKLRELYLEDFRARFKQQLDQIELVDEDDPRLNKKLN